MPRRVSPWLASTLAVLGLAVLPASAQEQAGAADARTETFFLRLARMEGASVNVEEASQALFASAERVGSSGRIHGLSEIVADATELNRRVVSLRLATEILDELD